MFIQQDESTASYQIQSYEPGKICINHTYYQHSVIIRPHDFQAWTPRHLENVTILDFTTILDALPQILLLGTGKNLIIPDETLLTFLFEKGIGVEFMDSKSACYTYTILAAEDRNVAACILIM